jgi:hypothetical protein
MTRRVALVSLVCLTLGVPAAEAGKKPSADPPCTVSGNVVSAAGLPTGQVINFLITDAGGTYGWVLGATEDGTWSVTVPAQRGPTTYQFVSRTWGPNGSKYTVFSSC